MGMNYASLFDITYLNILSVKARTKKRPGFLLGAFQQFLNIKIGLLVNAKAG